MEAMNKIESYIAGVEFDSFIQDKMRVDAVLRNIEIIGEAAKNIPNHIRKKHPGIPWRRIVGLRNIVIHEYFGVDLENIWKIITENIPEVKPAFIKMLGTLKMEGKKAGR